MDRSDLKKSFFLLGSLRRSQTSDDISKELPAEETPLAFIEDAVPSSPASAIDEGSVLEADVQIEGRIFGYGRLTVRGFIAGDVSAETIVVDDSGSIEGQVAANTIRVDGTILGTIISNVLALGPKSKIEGDFTYHTLTVQEGAHFQGRGTRLNGEDTSLRPSHK